MATRDEIERDIIRLGPWFHNLHMPGGQKTCPGHPLGDFPRYKWEQIKPHLATDLSGATVLDIGCNAGFYTIELARRGAQVTAIDVDEHYLAQARWATRQFGVQDRVRVLNRPVYDLARGHGLREPRDGMDGDGSDGHRTHGKRDNGGASTGMPERRSGHADANGPAFDIILFMGVFYHLRYPLLALDTVAALRPRLFVFQTVLLDAEDRTEPPVTEDVDLDRRHRLCASDWPKMAFIERTFCQDPTNWWVPNHAAVMAMLRSAGFHVVSLPGEEIYLCRPASSPPPVPWDRGEWAAAAGIEGFEQRRATLRARTDCLPDD